MKSKTKLILHISVLGLSFTLLMVSIFYLNVGDLNNGGDNGGDGTSSLPIFIDGDGPNNWVWAVSQSWCHGSGTWGDPYTIENLSIDGRGAETCIRIRDSNAFFIIRNCNLFNSSHAGITLTNVQLGRVFKNTISDNSPGILLENCEGNTILGNNIFDNDIGINISSCNYNNVTQNFIFNNMVGINASYSNSTFILGNSINNNGYAIWQFHNNDIIIYNNSLSYSTWIGIVITRSHLSQILENIISYNTEFGVILSVSTQNLFFKNNFAENGINAIDDGSNNQWDHINIGNYWSDYLGVDVDDDGIGDTPYNITGSAGSQDNYPIWDDGPG